MSRAYATVAAQHADGLWESLLQDFEPGVEEVLRLRM